MQSFKGLLFLMGGPVSQETGPAAVKTDLD